MANKKLNLTKETRGSSLVSIPAPQKLDKKHELFPTGYQFPIATLVNVVFDPSTEMTINNEEVTRPTLTFIFTDKKNRQFQHREFPIDDDAENFDSEFERMAGKIKHIFEQTVGESKFEDVSGDDFAEFFKNAADLFNKQVIKTEAKEGEKAKEVKVYAKNAVYIKLTYYKSRTQFPRYPNFVQKAEVGGKAIPCETLSVTGYDVIEQTAGSAQNNLPAGLGGNKDNTIEDVFPDI